MNILSFRDNEKLLQHIAIYLSDANQEVRHSSRAAFSELLHCFNSSASSLSNTAQQNVQSQDLDRLLFRALNEQQFMKVKEIMERDKEMAGGNTSDFGATLGGGMGVGGI